MTAYFNGQLTALRNLKGRRCPGEMECSESGRISEFADSGLTVLEICHGTETSTPCELRGTKPPTEPPLLLDGINAALDLEKLHEGGATFAYPDSLSPRQWAALRALRDARREAEDTAAKEAKDEQQRREIEQEMARLNALRGGKR